MIRLISALVFVFIIGCKEYTDKGEDMTISVPTSLVLLSTNVIDLTQLYDDTAWYANGVEVRDGDSIYSTEGQVPFILYDHYEPVREDIVINGSTYYDVIDTWTDVPPNSENTLAYSTLSDYLLDIEAFDPVTNYCKPVGPSDTICFTFISGETWLKTTSGPYGGTVEITIFETWRENMSDQQYFFYNGNLYRRYETQDSTLNTRWYRERTAPPTEVQTLQYVRPVSKLLPFDSKSYTVATAKTTMKYTLQGNEQFDTLALGHVKADNVTILFKSAAGTVITTINEAIDGSRDIVGNLEDWHTTLVHYSTSLLTITDVLGVDTKQVATVLGTGWVDNGSHSYTATAASSDLEGLSSLTSGLVEVSITLSGSTAGHVNGYSVDGTYVFEETLEAALALTGVEFTGTVIINYVKAITRTYPTVEIELSGDNIELGNIMLGVAAPAGMTNLEMKHSYKDYSVLEPDVWGNIDYVERGKVNKFSGSVDIDLNTYDRMIRLLTSLGQNLVIVNASSDDNSAPDSINVFASTQMIGRFESFNQAAVIKDGQLARKSRYSFAFTELL